MSIRHLWKNKKTIFISRFAYKIHLYEEYRTFCLMHMKKMEWFSKLSKEDKSHKAMMAKNKYKVLISFKFIGLVFIKLIRDTQNTPQAT